LAESELEFGVRTVDGFRLIAREEGVYGFYRGLSPTLIALVPNWAV